MTSQPIAQRLATSSRGFRTWLSVFGASLALFCTVGFLNAFGVFQEYYKTYLPGKTDFDISWIGSVSIFLLYIGAPVAGFLVDRTGPTILICAGSIGQLLALFLASLCTQYYQIFLTQGILLGASMSFIFCPAIAAVSRRLPDRRGLALGLAIGGSSIGGIVWPIMLDQLLYNRRVSFGWLMRAVAFTMLPLLSVACVAIVDTQPSLAQSTQTMTQTEARTESNREVKHAQATPDENLEKEMSGFSILKDWTFLLLCLGLAIVYLGLFTPFFYISTYATQQGLSSSTAFYLISAINASSLFGRVIPGHLADMYGHFNICTLSVFASGLVGFCWTATSNLPGLVIWCLVYGFTSGAVVSLQGACAGKLASRENQGTAVGLVSGSVSITALVGTPISGQILQSAGYLGLGIWTGTTLIVGAGVLTGARLRLDRKVLAAQ
ncbi:major facilitator superfamily transporter [Biscogniauxia sp. FL1348]|nr:major facilitator superfamily transporter [Biscogniauxia sp. FL1348]